MKTEPSSPMTNREHDTRLLGELQGSAREPSHTGSAGLELVDLLARVEAAEGAARDLDDAVALAFGWLRTSNGWRDPSFALRAERPRFTASLDAALALCDRVLPGNWVNLTIGAEQSKAVIGEPAAKSGRMLCAAKTPALALLAALLRALITQAQPSQTGESGEGKGEGR